MHTVTFRGVHMPLEAARAAEWANAEPLADAEMIRDGEIKRDSLLQLCLLGAEEPSTVAAWKLYVDAVEVHARSMVR